MWSSSVGIFKTQSVMQIYLESFAFALYCPFKHLILFLNEYIPGSPMSTASNEEQKRPIKTSLFWSSITNTVLEWYGGISFYPMEENVIKTDCLWFLFLFLKKKYFNEITFLEIDLMSYRSDALEIIIAMGLRMAWIIILLNHTTREERTQHL